MCLIWAVNQSNEEFAMSIAKEAFTNGWTARSLNQSKSLLAVLDYTEGMPCGHNVGSLLWDEDEGTYCGQCRQDIIEGNQDPPMEMDCGHSIMNLCADSVIGCWCSICNPEIPVHPKP
jgi:hypothetical protein